MQDFDHERGSGSADGNELSPLDLLLILVRGRFIILACLFVGLVVGSTIALTEERVYTASAVVLSELGESGGASGRTLATLRNFGISAPAGGNGGDLTSLALLDVAKSRQVLLAVARDTLFVSREGRRRILMEFLTDEVFGEPAWSLFATIKRLTGGDSRERGVASPGVESLMPIPHEERAAAWVGRAITARLDEQTGLITITARAKDPVLAAELASAAVMRLRDRVQEVFTNKTRLTLNFVKSQFEKAEEQLQAADLELAVFRDSNQRLASSRVLLGEERLLREVTFKTQLFAELQAQQTQAEIELQRSQPVITIIEDPIPPLGPSSPNRGKILITYLLVGLLFGAVGAFIVSMISNAGEDKENAEKVREITDAVPWLGLAWWRNFTSRRKA